MQSLTILHAGVVKPQIKETIERFSNTHPDVRVNACAGGSVDCARKALAGEPCDILALADYRLFDLLLCPQLCDGYRIFAGNRMVLQATHTDSPLNESNWLQILSDPATRIGHFDPQADPGGYRAVFCMQLADKVRPGLGKQLLESPNRRLVDHDHVDEVDYIFYYLTAARRDDKPFVVLPETMDLSNSDLSDVYAAAHIELADGRTILGTPIGHALSIPKTSTQKSIANEFMEEFLRCDFAASGFIPRSEAVNFGE